MADSVVAFYAPPPDTAAEAEKSTPTKAAVDVPTQDWAKFFSSSRVDPKQVRELVTEFHEAGKFDDVIALIEQAIIHGQIQPWMYEVLALTMETVGRPRAQVERVLLSSRDFIADDSDSLLYLAAYLTRFERYEQALRMYRQVAILDPLRAESYVMGLRLAERLQDPSAAMWTVPGVLTRAWGRDRQALHEQAEQFSRDIVTQLRETDHPLEAAALEQLTASARQRDLQVRLEWNGNGNLDLEILDPTGAACTPTQPASPGGVQHIQSGQGPRQEDCVEEAVAPFALSGEYQVRIKHLSGDIVGKRARLIITRYAGSPREIKQTQTVPLVSDSQTIRVLLRGGRLREPLATPQSPKAAALPRTGSKVSVRQLPTGKMSRPGATVVNVGFQPVIEFVPSGVQLAALAVVSGDRRYVRISTSPLFTSVTDVFTYSYTGATGPSTGGGNF